MYRTRDWWKHASEYEQYKAWCDAYHIEPESKKKYFIVKRIAKEEKGVDMTPQKYARQQYVGDHTDKELRARYEVAKGRLEWQGEDGEELTYKEFLEKRLWSNIDDESTELYNKRYKELHEKFLKEGYDKYTAHALAAESAASFVSFYVYGS